MVETADEGDDLQRLVNGKAAAWKTQVPGTTPNDTDFTKINGIEIMSQNGTPKL